MTSQQRWYLSWEFPSIWKWRKRIRTWIFLLKYLISAPTKYLIQNHNSFFGGSTFFFFFLLFFCPVLTELLLFNLLLKNISRCGWLYGIPFFSWLLEPTTLVEHWASGGGMWQEILIGQTVSDLQECLQTPLFCLENTQTCVFFSD